MQEGLDPERCWRRRPDLDPVECKGVREATENEEPYEGRCQACPVGDRQYCPEIDDLSRSVLGFSARYDHPAHADYRGELFAVLAPRLGAGKLHGWLARREALWEALREHAEQKRKEAEEREARRSRGGGPVLDAD